MSRMASEAMDVRLPFSTRMAMWAHLMMCRYCRRFRRQIHLLRRLSGIGPEEPPGALDIDDAALSPEARERLKKAVAARCGKGAAPEE